MNCELCGNECDDQFGDVGGAIVCGHCLGWYKPQGANDGEETADERATKAEVQWLHREGEAAVFCIWCGGAEGSCGCGADVP